MSTAKTVDAYEAIETASRDEIAALQLERLRCARVEQSSAKLLQSARAAHATPRPAPAAPPLRGVGMRKFRGGGVSQDTAGVATPVRQGSEPLL